MLFKINFKNSEPFVFDFPEPKKSGIYVIQNVKTHDMYVGSAVNLKQRWSRHKWALNAKRHHNQRLQRAWNKYGAEYFKFSPVAYCEVDALIKVEDQYIQLFNSTYNISTNASSRKGAVNSPEHNLAISEKAKVRWADEEFKKSVSQKICAALKTSKKIKSAEHHNARLVTAFGKSLTLNEWASETGIKRETIAYRLNRGVTPEEALNPKPRKRGPK